MKKCIFPNGCECEHHLSGPCVVKPCTEKCNCSCVEKVEPQYLKEGTRVRILVSFDRDGDEISCDTGVIKDEECNDGLYGILTDEDDYFIVKTSDVEEIREKRQNGHTFTGVIWDEFAMFPHMVKPIKNSPAKEHKNPIMTGLKKVTNFIDSLQEPLKSYIRLGWVELYDNKYVVTYDGEKADAEIKFGLVKHKTLEAYAEAEVKRLEKEEKKK